MKRMRRLNIGAEKVGPDHLGDGTIVIAIGNDAIWSRFAPLLNIDPQPAGEVKKFDAVHSSEQVRQQNLVWTAEHSTLGRIEFPGNPIRYSRSTVDLRLPPPTLGEHSDEIRNEFRKDS